MIETLKQMLTNPGDRDALYFGVMIVLLAAAMAAASWDR